MLGTVTRVTVRLYFLFLERLLPDYEREHICVHRYVYHGYIKYAQNFFVRKTVSIIKTQLVWPPTGAGPRQQFALVVKT